MQLELSIKDVLTLLEMSYNKEYAAAILEGNGKEYIDSLVPIGTKVEFKGRHRRTNARVARIRLEKTEVYEIEYDYKNNDEDTEYRTTTTTYSVRDFQQEFNITRES